MDGNNLLVLKTGIAGRALPSATAKLCKPGAGWEAGAQAEHAAEKGGQTHSCPVELAASAANPLRHLGLASIWIAIDFSILPPLVIAQLYRSRWRVEIFFKWIKQHLRIKALYGYSENAVKTQVWIAVAVYVLVAIARKRLGLDISLYSFLQVLSTTVFEKMPILRAFERDTGQSEMVLADKQLKLLDF